MKSGYDVFGKAYGVMLRNDVHAKGSIDHKLMQEMILVENASLDRLYGSIPTVPDMKGHPLYCFARSFRGENDRETIEHLLQYCANIAASYEEPFDSMLFGGTEKEILERGTDWCADMARVGAVLLQCNGIPARIVHLASPEMAYYGHVVTEAYYEGHYGVCDFLHGFCFYDERPLSIWNLLSDRRHLEAYPEGYRIPFGAAAISGYDPTAGNDYSVSQPNEYTLRLIHTDHQGKWFMGEDLCESITLELLTEENLSMVRGIRREDISESWVDSADTLYTLTCYGLEHNCIGHTYAVKFENTYIGVILLGEAIPWETDPEEMDNVPFYRLMGFVLDREYRGRGIGGQVLEMAIEEIYTEFGVRPIALGVHRDNAAAARFYEKHGFRGTEAMEGNDRYYLRYPERSLT